MIRAISRGCSAVISVSRPQRGAARGSDRSSLLQSCAGSTGGQDSSSSLTARVVQDSIGRRAYSVAILSYDGSWGFPGGDRTELPPAPAGSLSALLHDAGFTRAFVDVRGKGREVPPWLSAPMTGTLNTQSPARYALTWPAVVDGALFVDRMTPSSVAPE